MIPHNRPLITGADKQAVADVLESGYIAQGPEIAALETDFIDIYGGGGACAVSSGTAALFLALKGMKIGVGASVAVPTYSCSSLLNAVHMAGATPLVVDVRKDDFTIEAVALEQHAKVVDAVIAVHSFGARANIAALQHLNIPVLEDCCQSIGGMFKGRPMGSDGTAAVFSFYASKIVTGGQGGMIWDRTGAVSEAARDYREFDCREEYVPRFNLQMTDMQAAMVRSQLRRLSDIRARRQKIHGIYRARLDPSLGIQQGLEDKDRLPHRFVVRFPDLEAREAAKRKFEDAGISVIVPIERYELLHRYLGLDPDEFQVAESLADTTLSLPLYPALQDSDIARVADVLSDVRKTILANP